MIGISVALACALSWAIGSITIKDLSKKLDPFTLNAPRMLVAGVFLLLLTLATGKTRAYASVTAEKLAFMLASIAVGGGIGDFFYVSSIARVGVSRAFPVSSTYPAFTLVFGALFLREQIDIGVVVGLVAVLGGVLLIGRSSGKREKATTSSSSAVGVAFAVVTSVCWAAAMILLAPGVEGLDPIVVASIRAPALALLLWGIVACRKTAGELRKLDRKEWMLLGFGGIIGWGLGSVLFVLSVSLIGPTRTAILTSTSTLFALPLSVIFLKERVNALVLVGTALTVAGVIAIF